MSRADREATVVGLAMLTDDRTDDEHRALLEVAISVDKRRAAWTVTNRAPIRPYLFQEVIDSAPSRRPPPRAMLDAYARLLDRYDEAALAHAQHEDREHP